MSTPFQTIYNQFLASVDSYNLASLSDTTLEENLTFWLNKAIGYYPNPRVDLQDVDTNLKQFNDELNPIEIEAMAKFMLVAYLEPLMVSDQYLQDELNSKDYKKYSTANQLRALVDLRETLKREAYALVSNNSYSIASINKFIKKENRP